MSENFNYKSLNKLGINLTEIQRELFSKYQQIFLEKNSCLNLISKNDEKLLFEKHIYDSLAINLFLKPKVGESLLDFGTGGGFPSVPLSILYNDLNIYALDSIRKKVNAIEDFKNTLELKNLYPICERVEKLEQKFNYVASRAVASLDKIISYAEPKLLKGGYFVAYKSKKAEDEVKGASKTLRNSTLKFVDSIKYDLPLEDNYERNLLIFKKIK